MAEAVTNRIAGSVVEVRLEIWYVKTHTKNKNGWTLFHYGNKPPISTKNLIALCGNTMLLKQKEENGYYGFKVVGGNIQARTSHTKEIICFNSQEKQKEIEMVWLSKRNIEYLTQTKPNNFGKEAKVIVEIEARTFDNNTKDQVYAFLKYDHKQTLITLNTPQNSGFSIIPNGKYKILAPDYSHAILYDDNGNPLGRLASQYLKQYPNMQNYDVWFPIEYKDSKTNKQDRYIHPGKVSHGCVTIYDMNQWNNIFEYLISHRSLKNNRYIGEIEIRLL